jgi:hypothetical protein
MVKQITFDEAHPWVLKKHYARRIPNIKYAYGLYEEGCLVGVCTYGIPPSPSLCVGVCGKEFRNNVLELNRVCVDSDRPNACSVLVSGSLKMLPKETIVVSYADTSMGHIGYIYQATNFIYTGLSKKRSDPRIYDNKHSRHNKDRICDGAEKVDRPQKHRYIYFIGSKKWKKMMQRDKMKYPAKPYPKGDTQRYEADYQPETQMLLS